MNKAEQRRINVSSWCFMAPALLLLALFTFYPIACGVGLAFCDYSLLRYSESGQLVPPRWCGLDNFQRLVHDRYFWLALRHSCTYLLVVPGLQLTSILVALALNYEGRIVRFWRTALYLPVVTSAVCVGIIWRWLLRSDGAFNAGLQALGISAIPWLTDPDISLFSIMMVTFWQGVGYYMVLYLAGLQAIPGEYGEAARIDGASSRQVFTYVTLPLLKPSLVLCTFLSCISALKVFTEIYIMTRGGPRNSTLTLAYYIYQNAFEEFELGYATAIALCLAIVVGVITAVNYALTARWGEQ